MKATIQASLLLLAAALSPAILASPVPDTDSAPHTEDGAAVVNPGHNVTENDRVAAAASKKCITFTSDNANWHYANTGIWGSATGAFGSGSKQVCVPHNDNAGGAMFIGTGANPSAGNTKLECFFPSSGTANCDASLVDGYSLSVTCKVANTPQIGGPVDLFKTGKKCPDTSAIGKGICKNDNGGNAGSQGAIAPFFQPAVTSGNNYCIWWKCGQDYFFPVTAAVNCHISGGR